jgi:hypothetical protein
MDHFDPGGGKKQLIVPQVIREVAVVAAIAVPLVADDGVSDMLEVPADLVPSACPRFNLQKAVTTGGKGCKSPRGFKPPSRLVMSAGGL